MLQRLGTYPSFLSILVLHLKLWPLLAEHECHPIRPALALDADDLGSGGDLLLDHLLLDQLEVLRLER